MFKDVFIYLNWCQTYINTGSYMQLLVFSDNISTHGGIVLQPQPSSTFETLIQFQSLSVFGRLSCEKKMKVAVTDETKLKPALAGQLVRVAWKKLMKNGSLQKLKHMHLVISIVAKRIPQVS